MREFLSDFALFQKQDQTSEKITVILINFQYSESLIITNKG